MRLMRLFMILLALCCLMSCAGLAVRPDSRAAFETGLTLFNQGKYEAAIPHFLQATELDPEFGRAFLYLGRSYLNLQRWFDALAPLRTAWRLAPGETKKEALAILLDALLGAASARLRQGEAPQAVTLFKEAFTLAPGSQPIKQSLGQALLRLGSQLLSQGKLSEAIATYTEMTQIAPQNVQGYLGLARALFRSGDFSKGLSAATDALRLDPINFDALSLFQQLRRRH